MQAIRKSVRQSYPFIRIEKPESKIGSKPCEEVLKNLQQKNALLKDLILTFELEAE